MVFAQKENQKKLVMDKDMANTYFPFYNWATGFESMFYSAIIHPDSTVNFYIEENLNSSKKDDRFLSKELYLAVPWWTFWWIKDLNAHYFRLPPQPAKELIVEDGKLLIKDLRF